MPIRGVIFDYGGVLWNMRWDVTRALEAEHGLGERAIPEAHYSTDAWRQLEVGVGEREVWLAESHRTLEEAAGRPLPPIFTNWADQQHLIAPNIELIRRLRPRYRTGILSNADRTLTTRLRELTIADLFDDIVVSGEVGVAKPERRIYELAARRLKLTPDECVFIDDLERNVEGAFEAGMVGVHYRVDLGDDLAAQLTELGLACES